jgi:hypothetical protein
MKMFILLLPLAVIATEITPRAQCSAASRTFYGKGCGAGGRGLAIGNTHTIPRLGQAGNLVMKGGPQGPNTPAIIHVGTKQVSIDLTNIGMTGCTLLTAPIVGLATTFSAGGAKPVPFNIPNNKFLCGLSLHVQGVTIMPGANTLGVIASNAIKLTIGT